LPVTGSAVRPSVSRIHPDGESISVTDQKESSVTDQKESSSMTTSERGPR